MNLRRAIGTWSRGVLPLLFAALTGTSATLLPPSAHAGGVVILRSSDLPIYRSTISAFRRSLRQAAPEWSLDALSEGAAIDSVRAAQPEVAIAVGLRAAVLLRDRLPRVNLVYAMVPSPARHELTGSRITGVAADIPPELELQLLKQLAPDVRSVGVLIGRDPDGWAKLAREAGVHLGIQVRVVSLSGREALGPRVREMVQGSDAVWMPADADVATPETFRFMVGEALARRKPLLAFAPGLVRGGAFAAAAPDLDWVGARLAEAVRRIHAGERPGDIPATVIRRVRPVVNVATARALGRELPAPAITDAELVR